ncbi:fibronectin type III domain-containing protein [Dysgonomonas sp. Marseille-P4677]|uniref:metallophosphoesterase n=1 Tax=Dysgonomonas sp. Marseille-P4677 TaxID=2364790 RepID=UPI0019144E54|nr:metallophosphoesterase [Dysgonomonas sp. Marseille-P4677]MBK5722437.1 fibronectin type III domain-containing protein [Dysgonomonas sp. Marseille-P4677]
MKTLTICSILLLFSSTLLTAQNVLPKEENSIRILSYNTHNCIGMDNVTDYDRIANVILNIAPDAVALQELDSVTSRNKHFVLKEIADRTLMYPTYGAAIDYKGGKYGIGILSKEKPLNSRTVQLPGREEKRLLLIVEFAKYVLCCTHLSLNEEDRNLSVPIILEAIKDIDKPLFLAGDINDTIESPMQTSMSEKFTVLNNPKQATIGSGNNMRCIDFIYGYHNGSTYSVISRQVVDEQVASDHRPLFVDVRLKTDKSKIFRTKPYLQNPTNNGISILWLTNVPVHSWVEYSTDKQQWIKAETLADGQVVCYNKKHKIRLNNLKPGIKYYYRVCSREMTLYEAYKKEFGDTVYSDIYSFKLPASNEKDFTALIFNDLHRNKELMDSLIYQIKNIDFDLVFFNGDIIDDPKNEDVSVDFLSYINEKINAAEHPAIYLRGNHEIRNAYSIKLRELFDYIDDKTYGAFNWGDTRFVMLDCGEDKPDSTSVYYNLNNFTKLRIDQADFIKAEIKNKDFINANKRVLIHHIPIYGLSSKGYNPCLELWHPLLQSAPFNFSIHGHTHRFAYHPKGSLSNNFPVIIGGGKSTKDGTVMVLRKKNNELRLEVLTSTGLKVLNMTN